MAVTEHTTTSGSNKKEACIGSVFTSVVFPNIILINQNFPEGLREKLVFQTRICKNSSME